MDKQARDRLRALTDVPRNGSPVAFVASLQRNELRALLDALDAAEQRAEAAERDAVRMRFLADHWNDRFSRSAKRVHEAVTDRMAMAGGVLPAVDALIQQRDKAVAALGEQTGEGGA